MTPRCLPDLIAAGFDAGLLHRPTGWWDHPTRTAANQRWVCDGWDDRRRRPRRGSGRAGTAAGRRRLARRRRRPDPPRRTTARLGRWASAVCRGSRPPPSSGCRWRCWRSRAGRCWPAGRWSACVLLPRLFGSRREAARRLERLAALAEWTRRLASVLTAGAGLEQAIAATTHTAPGADRRRCHPARGPAPQPATRRRRAAGVRRRPGRPDRRSRRRRADAGRGPPRPRPDPGAGRPRCHRRSRSRNAPAGRRRPGHPTGDRPLRHHHHPRHRRAAGPDPPQLRPTLLDRNRATHAGTDRPGVRGRVRLDGHPHRRPSRATAAASLPSRRQTRPRPDRRGHESGCCRRVRRRCHRYRRPGAGPSTASRPDTTDDRPGPAGTHPQRTTIAQGIETPSVDGLVDRWQQFGRWLAARPLGRPIPTADLAVLDLDPARFASAKSAWPSSGCCYPD